MESWRGSGGCLQSLVSQDCQDRFHWLRGLLFVVLAFPAHRLAHGLVGLGASVTSQQPPIGDAIAHHFVFFR
eukprot:598440-Pelagomonas_calceolata.AAC.1